MSELSRELQRRVNDVFPECRLSEWRERDGVPIHQDAFVADDVELRYPAIIRGGRIHGGRILGGVIRGGEIYGGVIHDGGFSRKIVVRGGEVFGGGYTAGEILAGELTHGWRGGVCRQTPYARTANPPVGLIAQIGSDWLYFCGEEWRLSEWPFRLTALIRRRRLGIDTRSKMEYELEIARQRITAAAQS